MDEESRGRAEAFSSERGLETVIDRVMLRVYAGIV